MRRHGGWPAPGSRPPTLPGRVPRAGGPPSRMRDLARSSPQARLRAARRPAGSRPRHVRSSPKITRASSDRPAPIRPNTPTISWRCTVKLTARVRTRPGHVAELEHRTAEGPRAARGIHLLDLASHHLPHEHVHRERGHAAAGDDGAVAQHRDAIAEAEHVPKLMRDIDDGQPRVAQLANERVEAVALGGTERCRRLVQDQHARLRPERPCDLHQLALAGREALDQRVQRALEPHAPQPAASPRGRFPRDR